MTCEESYKILEIDSSCTQEDLKKQYKKKCFETHPDRNSGKNEEFLKVQEAYRTITEPRPSQDSGFNPFGGSIDISDILKDFGFGQRAQGMGFNGSRIPPQNDSEISVGIEASIEDIRKGKTFEIEYQKSKKCNACGGIGGKEKNKCLACNGMGMVRKVKTQGNSYIISQRPCDKCKGRGETIKNPCNACSANGFVVYLERLKFEIKER